MSSYWNKRMKAIEEGSLNTALKAQREIQVLLRDHRAYIEDQMYYLIGRFADLEGINQEEAYRLLSRTDLARFKRSLGNYSSLAKSSSHFGPLEKEVERLSAMAQISHLEERLARIELDSLVMYGEVQGATYTGLASAYEYSHYHVLKDLIGAGVATEVVKLNPKGVEKALRYNWSGKHFSTRIWGHEKAYVKTVRQILLTGLEQGQGAKVMARLLSKATKVSRDKSERLIRTEANFFNSLATNQLYDDTGLDEYQILATLDTRTSDICQDMDGKIFKVKDYKPGVNANPFHPYCRTTTIPVIDDELMKDEKRRSSAGVVERMNYEEWYKKYIQ